MEAQGIPVTIANLAIHRHREEEMNRERMRNNQTVQEAASQRAREANKGKARKVVPDSEEEESKEMYSSPSEECIAWSFIHRGNDTHFTVVLLERFGALADLHVITPPTPPPPSPPPSDEEPSAEMYDPAADLEGDPDEPYVAERVPYGAPEAYYSDASDGSGGESASAGSAPSSHHSSGSSSGSVSLGYGYASSGSASDGASDDDLVNRYFAWTFPPP
ncbi:hypothetical protein PIB30_084232 [Stylosanthes scabra]|uniref:Uncharacterized protein n=1 Tax=Stylosanthes scabra TaxID=79078 RepID=A0ABU6ZR31_9FABA|nr:hypothetical protein [Stylosanthes scabra]